MNLERSYARALYEVVSKDEAKGKEYIANLKEALKRRGHEKLFPKIFSEYEQLTLKKERSNVQTTVSPEQERTRILLELYQKLTQSTTN
jgi:F0F1-type ATP synthase delta subunit